MFITTKTSPALRRPKPILVELPRPPKNGSPVPHLTSLHAAPGRGPWGSARYPGNCGGQIIKDLLSYFGPERVLDPMTGSGTCTDVCRELGIPCFSGDVRGGFDASDPLSYDGIGTFDFVWLHPPYWRMKRYSDDARCLSNAPTLAAFRERLAAVVCNCRDVLTDDGKIAVLMGNYSDHGRFIPLTYLTADVCIEVGLWPACTEIIRFQHNNTSSAKRYTSSFIPGLHDTCLVVERDTTR